MVTRRTTEDLAAEGGERAGQKEVRRTPITVVVDNVRSLDNVGMLFRLSELALVERLYLTGYTGYPQMKGDARPAAIAERNQRRIEKTAVYALPYQPWEYAEDPVPVVAQLKETGYQVVALEQTDTSMPYHEALYGLPLVFIVGHERQGVRQELLELADLIVEIPILGRGNSHNVATATGIVLQKILEKTGII